MGEFAEPLLPHTRIYVVLLHRMNVSTVAIATKTNTKCSCAVQLRTTSEVPGVHAPSDVGGTSFIRGRSDASCSPEALTLPVDRPRPKEPSFHEAHAQTHPYCGPSWAASLRRQSTLQPRPRRRRPPRPSLRLRSRLLPHRRPRAPTTAAPTTAAPAKNPTKLIFAPVPAENALATAANWGAVREGPLRQGRNPD